MVLLIYYRNVPMIRYYGWDAMSEAKLGPLPGNIMAKGPFRYRLHSAVSPNYHLPLPVWILWPSKSAFVGSASPVKDWSSTTSLDNDVKPLSHAPFHCIVCGSATNFWRLMELDLPRPMDWVTKIWPHQDSPRVLVRLQFHPFLFKWGVDILNPMGTYCGLGACSKSTLRCFRGNAPPQVHDCLVNRSATTIPSVSLSSATDSAVERSGFTSSEHGFNWSDIVKGLSRGSQSDSVHVPQVTPASSPPFGGGGLFNSRFSSCLVTPSHSPASVSGSDSTIAVGISQVAAVMHDVPSSDISVTAGCMRENPTGDPISCGSGAIGVTSGPVISSPDLDSVFPVASGSLDGTLPVGDLSQGVTSSESAGVVVTAGCTAGNPTGLAQSVGQPDVGPVHAGLHKVGLSSGSSGSISSRPAGLASSLPGTDTTGPYAGLPLVSNIPVGPLFTSADGSTFLYGPNYLDLAKTGPDGISVMVQGVQHGLGSDQSVAPVVVPKEIVVPKGPSVVVYTVEPAFHIDDGFVAVKGKKWRKKKPNTSGPGVMTSGLDVSSVPVGPVSLDPKEDEVVVTQVSVAHVAAPLPLPKGNLRDKGKIPVSNQFASLGGPVLEDFDDYFDGVTGLWESERQTAHYYIEYGFKPPDFVFESWSPKLKAYFSQLTEVDSTDPGGPSQVIEEDVVIGDDVEEPPDELLLG
ncbi:hypothetical protein L1987_53871 [Smallanthus sonchifolius]|uniref:Uncharacterized protein n=1 Tax=Smallanthus sonchifolius TaxID=185202 RepID=A0ACB9EXV5_9ASTR|nr:hypothetical protein L1987_53871 [Smallanthus sonchifolius]